MLERVITLVSVRIIRPKSTTRAVPVWPMRMLAYEDRQQCKESVVNVATHTFEVSMCDPKLMKVRHAKCHLGKLWVVEAHRYKTSREVYSGAHQTQAVGLWIGLDELRNVSIGHPLRDDAEILTALQRRNSQQRQDILMRQAFPDKDFPTKLLDRG